MTVRLSPPRQALRLYFAPSAVAARIRWRLDPRLHFVGVLPRGRRMLTFTVPPLESGTYSVWCAGCDRRVRLRVRTPSDPCPVTTGRPAYGNGLLSTTVPVDGAVVVRPEDVSEEGLWWTKLIWRVRPWSVAWDDLRVVARRLDVSAPPHQIQTVRGSGDSAWSWAARMRFPGEGCYRVTGRVEDLALSFVVQVVIGNA